MTSTNCSCFLFRFSFLVFRFSRSFNSLLISYFTVSIEREYHLCWCTLLLDVDIQTILWLTFWLLTFLTECFLKIFNFCASFLVFLVFALVILILYLVVTRIVAHSSCSTENLMFYICYSWISIRFSEFFQFEWACSFSTTLIYVIRNCNTL